MFMLCTDCAPVTKAESLGPELTSTLANFQKYRSENTVKFGLVLVLLTHSDSCFLFGSVKVINYFCMRWIKNEENSLVKFWFW